MKISGVAIGQWNANCIKQEGRRRTEYKINRAIAMGKVTHIYENGNYIVRYHNINVLVDVMGIVLTVWKDNSRPRHNVPEYIKNEFDNATTHKQSVKKANFKHNSVISKLIKMINDGFDAYEVEGVN